MLWFLKKKPKRIVQCPACEWQPDGEKHWSCTCGHVWNTFKTRGKCPSCKTQWEMTWCPGCGQSTPHEEWYLTQAEWEKRESTGNPVWKASKRRLESRLIAHGIKYARISYLPYLDHTKVILQPPFEAACRLVILYAVAHGAARPADRTLLIDWLKSQQIWEKVSPGEREFLTTPQLTENQLIDYSWRMEGALSLAWCLRKVERLPRLDGTGHDKAMSAFYEQLPGLGEDLTLFFTDLNYRDLGAIYEENLLNELATTYFRDLMFNGQPDTSNIDRRVCFERHRTLNWLRQFMGISEWDETDTST